MLWIGVGVSKVKNIIILSNIEWKFLKQRHQFFALNYAKKDVNVIFVESSPKRNPKLKDIPRILTRIKNQFVNKSSKRTKGIDGIKVVTPLVFPSTSSLFNYLNKFFTLSFLIKKINKQLVSGPISIICYLPSETTLQLIKKINHNICVYDCVSNFSAVNGMPKNIEYLESELIKYSDFCMFDCDFLMKKHQEKSKKSLLVPPGVNFSDFDLNLSTKKIKKVVYFGLFSDKIDIEILQEISKNFELDIIGEMRIQVPSLQVNKIFEPVSHNELPSYIKNYDAIIIPYIKNEFMNGVIPAKFFECLATGLPLFVTDIPSFREYSNLVNIINKDNVVSSMSEYDNDDKNRLLRINSARENDWEYKTKKVLDIINESF